jgi:hypothetical protein
MRNKKMITPNKITIKGQEITDEEMELEIKKTKLNLQRALLKNGIEKEAQELEEKPTVRKSRTVEPLYTPEEEERRRKFLDDIQF